MRAVITIGSAVFLAAYANVVAGQSTSPTGALVSIPVPKNVLQRDGTYYVTSAYICNPMTALPRVLFNGVDIGGVTCISMGNAAFRVRPDLPFARGILTVLHAKGESSAGTYDIAASASPVLSVSPVSLSYSGRPTYTNVPPDRQTFEIRNVSGGTLNWTVTENLRWLTTVANEQCAVPPSCPDCGVQCSGGIRGSVGSDGASSISGSGLATVAVRAPGWTLGSGGTGTGTLSITSNGGNATVNVTITTPADMELDCMNYTDDDHDGAVDSNDYDCSANPFAGP